MAANKARSSGSRKTSDRAALSFRRSAPAPSDLSRDPLPTQRDRFLFGRFGREKPRTGDWTMIPHFAAAFVMRGVVERGLRGRRADAPLGIDAASKRNA